MRLAVFSQRWKHTACAHHTTTGGCTIGAAAPVDPDAPGGKVYIDAQHFDDKGLVTLMAAGCEIREGEGEASEVALNGTVWMPPFDPTAL